MKNLRELHQLLTNRGPLTLTEIGESLWGGRKNRQSYARPAGAMIRRLQRAGLVRVALSRDWDFIRDVMLPDGWMWVGPSPTEGNPSASS